MKKFVITGAALVAYAVPAVASADVSTNRTSNDAMGYCNANHIANFNGDFNGIGHLRSQMTGKQISEQNLNLPSFCVDSQGDYAPISNNG
jgi:hypothetical protein